MKLRGIKDSKGRRVAYERNKNISAPTDSTLLPGHSPVPQPSGALKCTGCTGSYSPAAFARHLTGTAMVDADAGVFITGINDPWILQQNPESQLQETEKHDSEVRSKQIELYYEQQRRLARTRIVDGVSPSLTD